MLKIAGTALLVLMLAPPVLAFSGPEHIAVSNLALRIAAAHAKRHTAADADELEKWTKKKDRTFGDVVALADQIKDVAPIFDTPAHQSPTKYTDLDWDHLHGLAHQPLRSLQAKTLNENHFQSLALASHLTNHRAAIGEARNGNWARALLFEAYALHHIEDFLSPGHVATARAGTADFVAIGLHDKYTTRGLNFRFDGDQALIDLAQFVADQCATPEKILPCKGSDGELDGQAFEKLASAMGKKSVEHFLGDSHLDGQPIQAAFVTIVAALSISEVLENSGDAFATYCWQWGGKDTPCKGPVTQRGMLRAAQIVGGGYEGVVRRLQFFIPGELLFVTLQGAVNPIATGSNFEGPVGKIALEIETTLAAVPQGSGLVFAPVLLAGYVRTIGAREWIDGAQLRLIVPIPRTNLQLSAMRAMELEHHERQAVGAALEAGFGFIFVRLGAQQNRNTPPLGQTENRAIVYTFGVSGIIPSRGVLHKASSLVRN